MDRADVFCGLQKLEITPRIAEAKLAAHAFPRTLISEEPRVALVIHYLNRGH